VGVSGFGTSGVSGTGNTLSGNDSGIVVADNGSSAMAVQVSGNTVSSPRDGIAVTGFATAANGSATVEANAATGAQTGVGLELRGDSGQTVGGASQPLGNTVSGYDVGLALETYCADSASSCGGAPVENQGDTIAFDSFTGNLAFGVLVEGPSLLPEFVSPPAAPTFTQSGASLGVNIFQNDIWTGNGATSAMLGANVADFGETTERAGPSGALTLGAAVPAGSVPGTITVTNPTASPVTLAKGAVIRVGGPVFGNPLALREATFYVSATTVLAATSTASVSVTSVAAQLDTPVQAIAAGAAIVTKTVTPGATAQTYGTGPTANSCTPSTGGSATLDTGTSSAGGGYFAC
jgi:hypothetical protein